MNDKTRREDRSATEERRKKAEELRKRLVRYYGDIFSSPAGMVVLDDILNRCHLWNTTFTGNSTGMFMEGERNTGLYILKMVTTANPNIIAAIINENKRLKLEPVDGRKDDLART